MYNSEYGNHNYTLQECQEMLTNDIRLMGSRYSLLSKALELLEVDEELVRDWFDVYMAVIDETSYLKLSHRLEELETQILKSWYTYFKKAN